MIEFNTDGEVLWANQNFANALGYDVNEIQKMTHKQFCTESFVHSSE